MIASKMEEVCMQKIEFRDEHELNYVVSVPVINKEKTFLLRMWVAYDRGGRYSCYDYAEVKRGYYLYFSFEEPIEKYPARGLLIDGKNCRLYLGEVKRHSKGWYKDFAKLASEIMFAAIEEEFSKLVLDWENVSYQCWSGKGSGVGMYCDFYTIILPKKEWLYGCFHTLAG